jgi:deoxyhypusine synthase
MSSAQLGITLAPAIRAGLIHGLSVTGANLEESLFRLVAHHSYKDFPDYRYFTKQDDTKILEQRMRRVTDTSIPEDEAFRAVEKILVPMWKRGDQERRAPLLARVLLRADPEARRRSTSRATPTSAGCSPRRRRTCRSWCRATRTRPSATSSPRT